MNLCDFGQRSGHKVPRISIGAMRFPKDTDVAVSLLRYAIDRGMRYIDTSRGYGESEWIIGFALKDGYRDKVILSSKWSPWNMMVDPSDDTSSDCVRRRIEESLKRLDVDYLDYYQVWSINKREQYDKVVAKGGMVEGMLKAKKEGLVGHLGFTTHDSVENLLTYIEEADWCEVLLTTYNLINIQYAPVIEAAHAKGIGTLIMNPVGGGRLAEKSPVLMALAKEVGDRKQRFTQMGGIRPYGVTLLISGMDNGTPHLYETDPSGAVREWFAHALGRGSKEAKKVITDGYRDDMEKTKAIDLTLKALKAGEKKLGLKYVEVGVVEDGKFHLLTKAELKDAIKKFA